METVIVICLLVVIVLLMQDKIVINKSLGQQQPKQAKVNPDLPDIMGQPKAMRSLSFPNSANERQIEGTEINPDNLDIEYDENESAGIQIPQEELDEVFSTMPDLEDEEEEWHRYGISGSNDNLAQGVTYDELSSVGALLQKENLKKAQKETAIAIVQKIQGTELFSLLENSIEGASRKIAMLLDSSLPETDSGSSSLRKNDLGIFDIGEFV
jgi:hypothetical protein